MIFFTVVYEKKHVRSLFMRQFLPPTAGHRYTRGSIKIPKNFIIHLPLSCEIRRNTLNLYIINT